MNAIKRNLGIPPKSRTSLQTQIVQNVPPKFHIPNYKPKVPKFPDLRVPFPDTPEQDFSHPLSKPKTQITTLNNGFRVATEDTYSQLTSFALYVRCGTRYEPTDKPGVALLLERLAFRSTIKKTTSQIIQLSEELGCSAVCNGDKENIVYSFVNLRENTPKSLELLADSVIDPIFTEEEIEEQLLAIEAEQESIKNNWELIIPQLLHKVAFPNQPMGFIPMDYWANMRENISREDLKKYKENNYLGDRMVLSAASVDHEEFVSLADKFFGKLPQGKTPLVRSPIIYHGGYLEYPMDKKDLDGDNFKEYFALFFKSCGWIEDDSYPMAILCRILGGGSAFSAGGPGKGMFSRLYVNFMNQFDWPEAAEAILTNYEDNGIVGIISSCKPGHLKELSEGICLQFMQLAYDAILNPAALEEELKRAKSLLKATIFTNLEQRSIIADDIGRQVLVYGQRFSGEYVCNKVDSITVEDCARVAWKIFESTPTVVTVGLPKNLSKVVPYQNIKNFFSQNKPSKN